MELREDVKITGGGSTRRSAVLFLQLRSRPYLMAGRRFTHIITALSNMKSQPCVWREDGEKGKAGGKGQRSPFNPFTNRFFYCHRHLFLHVHIPTAESGIINKSQ